MTYVALSWYRRAVKHAGLFALCSALAACGPGTPMMTDDGSAEASLDASMPDGMSMPDTPSGPEAPAGPVFPTCEETEPDGIPMLMPVASTLVGSIEAMMPRLAMPTVVSPVLEEGERMARMMGLMALRRGAGFSRIRRNELGGPMTAPMGERRSLAWFVHLADSQVVDDESPVRLAVLDSPGASGAIRPQEAWLGRAMTAINRTLTSVQRTERPFQFGVISGDCADSGQQNELRWFMQLMNGERAIHMDSGMDDDPIPGPNNDPKDPFDGVPFPAPWYYVPGNHDYFVVGITLPGDSQRAAVVGGMSVNGTRDYTRRWAEPRRGAIPADMNRRITNPADIVRELRTGPAMPGPVGHGFPENPNLTLGAHYATDVIPGLLRVLNFDTNDPTGGSKGLVRRATVDGWLRPELERAQRDGVLVMMASHHPTSSIDRNMAEFGGEDPNAVAPDELERIVAGYPNMIAWLVGHEHLVRVRSIRGADAAHPGFWELQPGSIADWPNQVRAMEVVNNGDGTLSIFGTLIDYEAQNCAERRFRRLARADMASGWEGDLSGTMNDRNVELVVPIPPTAMAAVQRATMTAPARIESETTLRGMR